MMSVSIVKESSIVCEGELILSGVSDLLMSVVVIVPKRVGHGFVE